MRTQSKKSNPGINLDDLDAIRSEIRKAGLLSYYKMFNVTTPEQLMLQVIFNCVSSMLPERNHDEKYRAAYQRCIFEFACEAQSQSLNYCLSREGIDVPLLRETMLEAIDMQKEEIKSEDIEYSKKMLQLNLSKMEHIFSKLST